MFGSDTAGNQGLVSIEVKSIVNGSLSTIASAEIDRRDPNMWYYLLTEAATASAIPANASAIQITICSNINGTVYVDFAQIGKVSSFTGNPSKLAIVEYQSWFKVPDFIPDARRFTENGYDGFSSENYDVHDWAHWQWGWVPDGGYNSDPAFYKQIGIKDSRIYTMINNGFEDPGYANSLEEWRRFPEPNDPQYPYSVNERTNEKAYEGQYSVKFTNRQSAPQRFGQAVDRMSKPAEYLS